jgi:hypothetical protein
MQSRTQHGTHCCFAPTQREKKRKGDVTFNDYVTVLYGTRSWGFEHENIVDNAGIRSSSSLVAGSRCVHYTNFQLIPMRY